MTRAATAIFAAAVATVALAGQASAAFPGKPGKIAFDSELADPGGNDEIFLMNLDGTGATRLTFNVLGNVENDDDPAFSGDGKLIVWEGDTDVNGPTDDDDEIFVMNSNGTGQRQLTSNADAQDDEDPALSRDGKRIVWEGDDPIEGDDEIFIMNADGTGATQLTFNNDPGVFDIDGEPVFSPDGKKIYFESNRSGNPQIWVMNVNGSGQTQLTFPPAGRLSADPDVSQDGRQIVFTSDRTGPPNPDTGFDHDVWVMDTDGSDPRQLTFDAAFEIRPVFSPDSSRIAFSHSPTPPDPSEISVINADGSGRVQLTSNALEDDNPDWQPIPVKCGGKRSTIVGTPGNDTLIGTAGKDVIAGIGGRDTIKGLKGKDRLCGGKGKDKLVGGKGPDRLFGGKGKDKLIGGPGPDRLIGGKGPDILKGGGGKDVEKQ